MRVQSMASLPDNACVHESGLNLIIYPMSGGIRTPQKTLLQYTRNQKVSGGVLLGFARLMSLSAWAMGILQLLQRSKELTDAGHLK